MKTIKMLTLFRWLEVRLIEIISAEEIARGDTIRYFLVPPSLYSINASIKMTPFHEKNENCCVRLYTHMRRVLLCCVCPPRNHIITLNEKKWSYYNNKHYEHGKFLKTNIDLNVKITKAFINYSETSKYRTFSVTEMLSTIRRCPALFRGFIL